MSSTPTESKTPSSGDEMSPSPTCLLTPTSVSSGNGSSSMCTPKQNPIRLRALENLMKERVSKSPQLQIPASPVMERLGYGTGVGVFLLERSPRPNGDASSPWAIKKTMRMKEDDEVITARLEYEADILRQLCHPNIIGYRAFGKTTSPDAAFLALEKASKSLSDLIEDRVEEVMMIENCDEEAPFPAKKIEKVAIDVGKALTYLHDEMKMVHGDVKSANVLVFGDFETIKICDFGVARKLNAKGEVEGNYVGTEIWNALEVITVKRGGVKKFPITHKADMYPFGLTIFEMISLKPPHLSSAEDSYLETSQTDNATDDSVVVLEQSFDEEAYELALSRYIGTRPLLPDIDFDSSYNHILGVFYCCTEEDPSRRPDAKDVVAALEIDAQK
ncbi:Lymphokine-activated killer T-cell-originated protein kinase [Orchesella cincta]|uniref:Lymphokine-activated killer T-cell-originated protein kinase n=1 Tax=Orchesella cincta TaxID=48709 RepID=A0A1D2N1Z5_ORCCI|nr:Lymphokine-activated killer T-cell-originated protein kinase [Orchesella cincta]